MLAVVLVGLFSWISNVGWCGHVPGGPGRRCQTYEWQAAVVAGGNLGLVGVDEDPGVSVRATTSIASHDSVVSPADRLLVDEIHGRVGLGLWQWLANRNCRGTVCPVLAALSTWRSKSVCSKRGPVIASLRGC